MEAVRRKAPEVAAARFLRHGDPISALTRAMLGDLPSGVNV
jgi:hypothetical protein